MGGKKNSKHVGSLGSYQLVSYLTLMKIGFSEMEDIFLTKFERLKVGIDLVINELHKDGLFFATFKL